MTEPPGELYHSQLPAGIGYQFADNVNGLKVHYLEAGEKNSPRGTLLLLHGFPELAFSWRKLILPLAQAGFHVIAPDQRGYGLTTGWEAENVLSFRMQNLTLDCISLLASLEIEQITAVIGHDFGAPVAGYCALIRPDLFRSVAMLGAPFPGVPRLTNKTDTGGGSFHQQLDDELAQLSPPRKHYQWYYSSERANQDMLEAPQGLHNFMRAYYHSKSADREDNAPQVLTDFSAAQFGRMPNYYVMQRHWDMAATVAPYMPSPEQIARCNWLRDEELSVYADSFRHSGFQGALNWYRCITDPRAMADLSLFSGLRISVPSCFIAGTADWCAQQTPGALARMESKFCAQHRGSHFLPGAGHWVQQEQPEQVLGVLNDFLTSPTRPAAHTQPGS
jgi:pimeloyl-ACP methyl ester carboxylesterase